MHAGSLGGGRALLVEVEHKTRMLAGLPDDSCDQASLILALSFGVLMRAIEAHEANVADVADVVANLILSAMLLKSVALVGLELYVLWFRGDG